MADIFISFIHEEHAVASAVQRLLQSQLGLSNQSVFVASDEWQIFAGEDWLRRIKEELSPAKIVILMLSPRSIQRPWVNFEAGAAWITGIPIIPACFAGLLKHALPKPYSNIQALELPGDAYYLITSVAHYLNVLPPPPVLYGSARFNQLQEAIREVVEATP
jgi:hypothetical protein